MNFIKCLPFFCYAWLAALATGAAAATPAGATPELRVTSVRKVFSDGNHNAFTDLCRFEGRLYLAFRTSPTGHGVATGSEIVVLASPDGGSWQPVFRFGVPERDVRDPHFLVFRGKLFVYTGTWLCHPDDPARHSISEHLGYAALTSDGQTWQGPQAMEGTYGYYVWRAATHGGKAYLCGRRIASVAAKGGAARSVVESVMLQSGDGLGWSPAGLFQAEEGNETAFLFEANGEVVAVARGSDAAQLCRAAPPYQQWTRTSLGRYIGGPLLAKWGDHYLVGGRKQVSPGNPKTVLSWLVDDKLVDVAELPSGGDNSYPGFVALDDRHALISYYSSHEGSGGKGPPASIYLAQIELIAE